MHTGLGELTAQQCPEFTADKVSDTAAGTQLRIAAQRGKAVELEDRMIMSCVEKPRLLQLFCVPLGKVQQLFIPPTGGS